MVRPSEVCRYAKLAFHLAPSRELDAVVESDGPEHLSEVWVPVPEIPQRFQHRDGLLVLYRYHQIEPGRPFQKCQVRSVGTVPGTDDKVPFPVSEAFPGVYFLRPFKNRLPS